MISIKFRNLNVSVGDIIYQRMNGVVTASKVMGFVFGGNGTLAKDSSFIQLLYPTGETQEVYTGFSAHNKYYASIEDCIDDANPITSSILDIVDIADANGLKAFSAWNDYGMMYQAVKKWKWDGYKATEKNVPLYEFLFIYDNNGWHYTQKKSSCPPKYQTKYYDTKEECIANNFVKVVTF